MIVLKKVWNRQRETYHACKALKSFSATAPPRAPLVELTTLPRPSNRLGGRVSSYSPPSGRFQGLAFNALSVSFPTLHQILPTSLVQPMKISHQRSSEISLNVSREFSTSVWLVSA